MIEFTDNELAVLYDFIQAQLNTSDHESDPVLLSARDKIRHAFKLSEHKDDD